MAIMEIGKRLKDRLGLCIDINSYKSMVEEIEKEASRLSDGLAARSLYSDCKDYKMVLRQEITRMGEEGCRNRCVTEMVGLLERTEQVEKRIEQLGLDVISQPASHP